MGKKIIKKNKRNTKKNINIKNKKRNTKKNKKRNTKKNINIKNKKRNTKRKTYHKKKLKVGTKNNKDYYINEFKDIDFFKQKIEEMSNVIFNNSDKARLIFNDTDGINNKLEKLLSKITSIQNLHELYDDDDSDKSLFLIYFIFNYYIMIVTDKEDYDEYYIIACSEIASNIYNYLIDVLDGTEFELISNDFDLDVIDKYLNYFMKKYYI